MPRNPVTRDPYDPSFPHGEARGYRRGCDCDDCKAAYLRARKRDKTMLALYGSRRAVSKEVQNRVAHHIDRLLEAVPLASRETVCDAAGVNHSLGVSMVVDAPMGMSPQTARRVLAVTPAAVRACPTMPMSREEAQLLIGQMQALGYPLTWQRDRSGVWTPSLAANHRGSRTVNHHVKVALTALHKQIDGREADPERDGISLRSIGHSKAVARRNGFHPPGCYDDDGNLDRRLIPGDPWAESDEHAHDMIAAAHIVTARSDDERRERLARTVGLHSAAELPAKRNRRGCPPGVDPVLWTRLDKVSQQVERIKGRFECRDKDPNRRANIARLREELIRWENSTEDALTFGLRTGVVAFSTYTSHVARDHPAVVAYLDQQTSKEAA